MPIYYAAALLPSTSKFLGYKLVGENIDKGVKARYMRVDEHRGQHHAPLTLYACVHFIQHPCAGVCHSCFSCDFFLIMDMSDQERKD